MIRYAGCGAALLVGFLLLGYLGSDAPLPVDVTVREAVARWPGGISRAVVAVISELLGPVLPLVALAVLAGATIVALRRARRHLVDLLLRAIALLVICRLVSLFKLVFQRPRPQFHPSYLEWSYPSGHVVSVASVAVTAVVLCAWLAPRLLGGVLAGSALAVLGSGACRVLLDLHWLTDVVGGVLGVTAVALLVAPALKLLPVGRLPVESASEQA